MGERRQNRLTQQDVGGAGVGQNRGEVIAHRRAGVGGSSPSESYGDSRAAKGLGEANRE